MRSEGPSTDGLKRMSVLSSILIYLGSCLLALVGGVYAYARFEAWSQAQPRTLVSTRMVWPQVPPMTPLPSPTITPLPTATPTPAPTPGPPIFVEIPSLDVKRAIVPVGLVSQGGQLAWDAESLFATSSRRDLVGHLDGTANPGQPGNVVLIGHNYNRGVYNWRGVFYALAQLQPGEAILLHNEQSLLFRYRVERVDKVPWQSRLNANTPVHVAYLSPTQDETLTLVTCGGANFAPFPSRIYVIAKRSPTER